VIRAKLALSGLIAAGLVTGAASCQSTAAASNEQVLQEVAELRAEVRALERTVARLEQELAEAKIQPPAVAAAPATATAAKAPAAKARCAGTTKSGVRCKRSAREGSRFCWQHAGQ
jgi:phage shock protein A